MTSVIMAVINTASGGGTFAHRVAATGQTITGIFATSGLVSFPSYCSATPQGLPATFFGGKLLLSHRHHPGTPPEPAPGGHAHDPMRPRNPAAVEGIRVNVKDVINSNKSVANVYIQS